MLVKILKKDFVKKKRITITLIAFILLSALLAASGSNMIMELFNSMNYLFEKSSAPHYSQMHAGEIDQAAIDCWSSNNSLVKEQQTVEMINIDGSNIYIGSSTTTEKKQCNGSGFCQTEPQI
jgi:putative ABC transport system permease protein